MAPYGRLLLAPAEGWWPLATWRALQALWIAEKNKIDPHFFYRGPPIPPCCRPPYPLHRFFFTTIFFKGTPPYPPAAAILDFTDVKKREGGKEWNGMERNGTEGTRLGFLCGYDNPGICICSIVPSGQCGEV